MKHRLNRISQPIPNFTSFFFILLNPLYIVVKLKLSKLSSDVKSIDKYKCTVLQTLLNFCLCCFHVELTYKV